MLKKLAALFFVSLLACSAYAGQVTLLGAGKPGAAAIVTLLEKGTITPASCTTCTVTSTVVYPASGRVAAAFAWGEPSAGKQVSSVSFNGTAGTLDANSNGVSNALSGCIVASASGMASGAGTFTVTFSGANTNTFIYALYSVPPTIGSSNTQNSTATSLSMTDNVSAGGALIACGLNDSAGSGFVLNGGVTADQTGNTQGTNPGAVGSQGYPAAATPATVTSNVVTSSAIKGAVAAYNP